MANNKSKINVNIPIKQGKNFEIKTIEMPEYDYPIFCLKHLHKDYNLDSCNDEEKKSLMEKLVQLSKMTWEDLRTSHRHGAGAEKIAVSSINPSCPSFITEEVDFLLAFRFQGKKPILGHRNRFVFHIIFIDRDFTVYNH